MKFVDPGNPAAGLRFDGRLSEDFKLLTGTWVRAAELRLELLRVLEGLATDLMIVGRDRSDIGLLIVPFAGQSGSRSRESCGSNGLIDDRRLLDDIEARLKEFNLEHATTSTRIVRAAVLAELPSMAEGEMTAKGNLNFNKLQQTRSALIDRLYDDDGEGATDTAIIHTGKTS